jgi:hypothetical protein
MANANRVVANMAKEPAIKVEFFGANRVEAEARVASIKGNGGKARVTSRKFGKRGSLQTSWQVHVFAY